jgi:hypothetical protein
VLSLRTERIGNAESPTSPVEEEDVAAEAVSAEGDAVAMESVVAEVDPEEDGLRVVALPR